MFWHFKDGISNLEQVTGRAQWDLQHYTVALIADAAPPGIVIAIWALMDFWHLLQATVINEVHCQKILNALQEFMNIKLMQSVVPSIHQVGSLLQWSVNTTEHAHIFLIKAPAYSTNNNNVDAQICLFLDCAQATGSQVMDDDSGLDDEGADVDETDIQTAAVDYLWEPKCPITNFFKKAKQVSSNIKVARPHRTFVVGTSTAIHLNFDPSLWRIPVDIVAENFSLPDLWGVLTDHIKWEGHSHISQCFQKLEGKHHAVPDTHLPFDDLMVWFKVRVQQISFYSQSVTPPALTINASPPSATRKYGHYDAAIFSVNNTKVEQ
ncbi:hypothetical protein C8R48DRAFT_779517 [Suillus tomentosus]|nr:hypothetical protein C8R48DRAFT_779517 [Suillus tomentosus]